MASVQRMLPIWITRDDRYEKRFEQRDVVYIDGCEDVKEESPIIGKDIFSLDWEGLQHLAILKNLRKIPLYKSRNLREAREKAYREYSEKILGVDIPEDRPVSEWPKLTITGHKDSAETEKTKSNDEVISAVSDDSRPYTMDELKEIAKDSGIQFHPNIGYNKLKERVFA